jgi:hemoglobin
MGSTLFEQLGGEAKLREIIGVFMDRVFEDRMIGFFFRNADKQRIKELEYQLTAEFLGAPVRYQGRPLNEAHAGHPIMGGQFARRQQILKEVLEEYGVAETIRDAWLDHNESLRPLVTKDAGSDCDPTAARERALHGGRR